MVNISQDILTASHLTEDELKKEIALMLYSQRRLSFGKASFLAEMDQEAFRELLFVREISHYDIDDLHQDVDTLKHLG